MDVQVSVCESKVRDQDNNVLVGYSKVCKPVLKKIREEENETKNTREHMQDANANISIRGIK